jgi:hypothetical protein
VRDGAVAIRNLAEAIDNRVVGGYLSAVTGGDGMIYVYNHGLGVTPTRIGVSQFDNGAPQDPFAKISIKTANNVGIGFQVLDMRSWTPFGGNQFSFYWWAQK